jgi:hypothetical protein
MEGSSHGLNYTIQLGLTKTKKIGVMVSKVLLLSCQILLTCSY